MIYFLIFFLPQLATSAPTATKDHLLKEMLIKPDKYRSLRTWQGFAKEDQLSRLGQNLKNFESTTRRLVQPSNDDCTEAIEVFPDGKVTTGSTEGATYEEFSDDCDFGFNSSDLWYSVIGTGDTMRADTCSENTNFDTVLSIYRGSCGELRCVGTNDDGCVSVSSVITWKSELSVKYLIRVHGFGDTQTGDFGLTLSTFEPAVNDLCNGAIALTIAKEVEGSMEFASWDEGSYDCFNGNNEQSLWYYIDGTGAPLKVSTCSPNSYFSGGMQIFKGSDCSNLRCEGILYEGSVSFDNDCAYPSATTRFFAEEGTRYHIVLLDGGSNFGENSTFTLRVTEFEVAQNDVCETALPIRDFTGPTIGSTTHALFDNIACGSASMSPSSGVWYTITGTGDALAVSTCSSELNFDSVLYIFSGNCGALECIAVGNNFDGSSCDESLFGSARAVFNTVVGVQYYILVTGAYSTVSGDFGLTITETKTPPNDLCSGAIELTPDTGSIKGSISNATGLVGSDISCMNSFGAPLVWYSLIGTGDVYAVSTCSSELTFDSGLSVLTGTCDTKECITYSGYSYYNCTDTTYSSARVIFRTEVGVKYFIAVEGLSYPEEGEFALTIDRVEAPPNDDCSGATVIPQNKSVIHGSITNATALIGSDISCAYSYDAPSVWYSLIGTGDVYAVSTCSSQLNFDSALSVSKGSCDSQECVTSNGYSGYNCADTTYSSARVIFRTEVGVKYFIAVEGLSYPAEGKFALTIDRVEAPPNDECSGATVIPQNKLVIQGSITNATGLGESNVSCAYSYDAPSVWYSLIGTGDVYAISTCNSRLNFDSALSVFTGSCGSQNCLTSVYGAYSSCEETFNSAARIVVPTEVGVEYLIAVEGLNYPSAGTFTLTLSPVEVPPNNICSSAILIQPDNSVIYGSTENATYSGSNTTSCDEFNTSPDVWYRVVGTGTSLTASLCGTTTTYDSKLAIFAGVGDDCDRSCIISNDDYCGVASQVEWFAETAVTYYIRIYGFSFSTGPFELRVF